MTYLADIIKMKLERSTSCEVLVSSRERTNSCDQLHRDDFCRYTVQINDRKRKNGMALLSSKRVVKQPFLGKTRKVSLGRGLGICELPEIGMVRSETCPRDLNACCMVEHEKKTGENKWRTIRRKLSSQVYAFISTDFAICDDR